MYLIFIVIIIDLNYESAAVNQRKNALHLKFVILIYQNANKYSTKCRILIALECFVP